MADTVEGLLEEELKVKCTECDWEGSLNECFRDAKCPECQGVVEWV